MQLEAYLSHAPYFSLGHLPTESLHPDTQNLSDRLETDLAGAIAQVQKIDLHAVGVVSNSRPLIEEMARDIDAVVAKGRASFSFRLRGRPADSHSL